MMIIDLIIGFSPSPVFGQNQWLCPFAIFHKHAAAVKLGIKDAELKNRSACTCLMLARQLQSESFPISSLSFCK